MEKANVFKERYGAKSEFPEGWWYKPKKPSLGWGGWIFSGTTHFANRCIPKINFIDFYAAGHNMLLAHAKAWHTYNKEFRGIQNGKVSVVVNAQWYEPKTSKEEDIKAADRGMQWFLGWMAHPVFIGDYPEIMKTQIMEKSKVKGIPSR